MQHGAQLLFPGDLDKSQSPTITAADRQCEDEDLEEKDSFRGVTPLHIAVESEHESMASFLLDLQTQSRPGLQCYHCSRPSKLL